MRESGNEPRGLVAAQWTAGTPLRQALLLGLLGSVAIAGCDCDGGGGQVDPVVGSLELLAPTDGASLSEADDTNTGLDGVQPQVEISAKGAEGGSVTVSAVREGTNIAHSEVTLDVTSETLLTNELTLVEGNNQIRAVWTNEDGDVLDEVSIQVSLTLPQPEDPQIAINSPVDGAVVGPADDRDPNVAGIQIDVVTTVTNVPDGSDVSLAVNGAEVEVLDSAGENLTFPSITVPEGSVSLLATAITSRGSATDRVSITVEVPDAPCTVAMEPLPVESCDFTASSQDSDPEQEGFQTTFLITSNCDTAVVTLNGNASNPLAVDNDGTLEAELTLVEGENTIQVEASRRGVDGGTASTEVLSYFVDTVAPGVRVDFPEEGRLLTFQNLGDEDPSDGLTVQVLGQVTNHEGEVALLVNGEEVATGEVDAEGIVALEVVLTEGGEVTLGLQANDGCDNQTLTEVTVTVSLEADQLVITAPEDGTSFGPLDDGDANTPGLQTTFSVESGDLPEASAVHIECRALAQQAFLRRSQDVEIDAEGAAQIPVTLPDGAYTCRARSVDPDVRSEEVLVSVALIREELVFTRPEEGVVVNTRLISVAAQAVNVAPNTSAVLTLGERTYSARVLDGGIFFPNVELVEGENVLSLTVETRQAPEVETTVVLDTLPPTITFTSPAPDAALTAADDESGDLDDGFEIAASLQIEGAQEGAPVCIVASYNQERCGVVGADGSAIISGVELLAGETTLTATVSDAVGNQATAQLVVSAVTGRPLLQVTAPENNSATTSASVNVTVGTDLAEGVEVSLYLNGGEAAVATASADQNGTARFTEVALVDNQENTLRASGADDRGLGWSPTSLVVVDNTVPEVVFVTPMDGAVINRQVQDVDGAPGFQTNVTISSEGVVDGQPAVLVADCGQGALSYEASLSNSRATFRRVTLRDNTTCTLTGRVTNRAMTSGESSATVRVDRTVPTLQFARLRDGDVVNINDDINPLAAGLQISIRVNTVGFEAGQVIHLSDDMGDVDLDSSPLNQGQTSVVFGPLTLPDRELVLTASGMDTAGNPATVSVGLLVDSSDLVITLTAPQNNATLTVDDDTNPDLEGLQISVVAAGVPALKDNAVRLCGDAAPQDAEPCETGGYRLLAEGVFQGDVAGATFSITLPEGNQSILAESRLEEDNQLIVSPQTVLTVDTVRPEIATLALLSDSVEPVGVVGRSEDGNPNQNGFAATFRVQVVGVETGNPVRLYEVENPSRAIAGQPLGLSDTVDLSVVLREERQYNIFANTFDNANNDVAEPPVVSFVVDLTPPTLSVANLSDGQRLSAAQDADREREGLQYAVEGISDEIGGTVILWAVTGELDPFGAPVDDVSLAMTQVDESGAFNFGADVQIPEGFTTLAVRVGDEASNYTDVLATIEVDVTAPEVTISAPESGATLTQEDPAFQATPGFQVAFTVQSDTPGAPVAIYNVGEGSPLSSPVVLGQDGQATVVATLTRGLNQLEARVTDDLGNQGRSAAHDITLDLQGCGVIFTQPTGNTLRVSQDNDEDPNNGVALGFEAVVGDVETCQGQPVELYVDGQLAASVTLDQSGTVSFTDVVFPNASTSTVLAQVDDGQGNVTATSLVTVLVDLIPPTVAIVSPADAATFGVVDDLSGAMGLQTSVVITVQNAEGGTAEVSTSASNNPVAGGLPLSNGQVTLSNLTFPEGEQTVTVTVTDLVGATASAQVDITVDLTRPAALVVSSDVINPRLGNVELSWPATGDDAAVGMVTRYEVRRSTSAITNMTEFRAAELIEAFDAAAMPGAAEGYTVESLPWTPPLDVTSITHHIAVVAFDDVGNNSPLGSTMDVTLGLRESSFGALASAGAFGFKTFPIGDVNNDGFADLAVFGNSPGGRAFVVYGGDDAALAALNGTTADIQRLVETDPFPVFGAAAVGLGDINGDEIDDFAVAAYFAGSGQGKVNLYFGVDGGAVNDTPDAVVQGPPLNQGEFAFFGIGLGVAENFADVADEGLPDLLVGSYGENGFTGTAYAILGRTSWPPVLQVTNGDDTANGVVRIEGDAPGGSFGYAVVGLGDVDNDGFSEIAVSAPYVDAEDGIVHVFFGGAIADLGPELVAGVDSAALDNYVDGGQFGGSMVARDLNADGLAELVVGAYAGNDAVGIFDFSEGVPLAPAQFWRAGQGGQLLAEQIALPDINGDTMPDVVLGGSITSGSQGVVHFYFNDDGAFSGLPPQVRYSRGSKWGNDVTNIGDINGDGYDDIAVSLPESGTGAIVILY